MTDSETPEAFLRVRITSLPRDGEFDEFDMHRFNVGQAYDLPARFASFLIIAGHGELVAKPLFPRAVAADNPPRKPKRHKS